MNSKNGQYLMDLQRYKIMKRAQFTQCTKIETRHTENIHMKFET